MAPAEISCLWLVVQQQREVTHVRHMHSRALNQHCTPGGRQIAKVLDNQAVHGMADELPMHL